MKSQVKWEYLLPKEFSKRQEEKSLVFLPIGICEPHGHIAPFGLDTLKAEYLCVKSAELYGGIVAPTLGYQIHETGFHARWLQDVVGEVNPHMTAMPTEVILKFFLYQLRAFANAGFKTIFALTGHAGGNQNDLRVVAQKFSVHTSVNVIVKADPELVEEKYSGDHAGKYEISQLLYLYPELVNMNRINDVNTSIYKQFAQGNDANEASSEYGKNIILSCIEKIGLLIKEEPTNKKELRNSLITYEETEIIWKEILEEKNEWITLKPNHNQLPVSLDSQWLPFENIN